MTENNNENQDAIICPIEMLSTFVGAAQRTAWPYGVEGARDPEAAARIEETLIRANIDALEEIGTPEGTIAAQYARYIFE